MIPPGLGPLARLSARIGADPEQVQAAGGNTSLKLDDVLWVKASGLWLADALQRNVFAPVRLGRLRDGIEADLSDPVSAAVAPELDPSGLRPSIETTLHGLLPHRVVVHTHSVRTLALAIRADAEPLLSDRLDGLAWAFVPYAHPGLPLTRAVAARLAERPIDVLILGNHGLVVGGTDVDGAEALLAEVERRLDAPARLARAGPPDDLARAAAALGLRLPRDPRTQTLAFDPQKRARAVSGSFYPDHVIFLGPAGREVGWPLDMDEIERALAAGSRLLIVPERGVLLPAAAPESADALALCLALVLARVPGDAALRHLGAAAERALLGWDAEKYRQSLSR